MFTTIDVLEIIALKLENQKKSADTRLLCYISEGVSRKTIDQLIALNLIVCKSKHNSDGSIPILVFLHQYEKIPCNALIPIMQVLINHYPDFKIVEKD